MSLVPRGPRVPEDLLVRFDVDCGELVPGHHLVARGLRAEPYLRWDGSTVPGVSLEYELVPGVGPDEFESIFEYLVAMEYEADVPLDELDVANDGGALAPPEGGPTQHGSRGPWPLPDGARVVRVAMSRALGPVVEPPGTLVVDLASAEARWVP